MALLEARGLTVAFADTPRPVIRGVDLGVDRGTILGLVGETGAGKTLTIRAILRAVRKAHISAAALEFDGTDLLRASKRQLRALRGDRIGYVVQDARNALNPMQTVGTSLGHIIRAHQDVGRREARDAILTMFASVGLPDPENVYSRYPHELSGGMAQRAVIAAALLPNPDLIVADEATTGLDLTIQAHILDFLRAETERRNAAAIIVTHDLGIVAQYCTEVALMYAGRIRERGPVHEVFDAPAHPYTRALLEATAGKAVSGSAADASAEEPLEGCEYANRCSHAEPSCFAGPVSVQRVGARTSLCRLSIGMLPPISKTKERQNGARINRGDVTEDFDRILVAKRLRKSFKQSGKKTVHAVNEVGIEIVRGETLALVGESGSGKSTVGRCLLRLIDPDSGEIVYDGSDITRESARSFRRRRTELQAVFQDPASSLDHRMRAIDIVTEPLAIFSKMSRVERRLEGRRLMDAVGLSPTLAGRYPRQMSGGQQQRLAIARAIATRPRLIVLDEPTASLDMSVRGQILRLFRELQDEFQLSYLLISHDLQTVRQFASRLVVMYLGEIVEQGPAAEIFERPRHPYTKALLSAELAADPTVTPNRVVLTGDIPKPTNLPIGCYLASRCPFVIDACRAEHPPLAPVSPEHLSRCIRLEVT